MTDDKNTNEIDAFPSNSLGGRGSQQKIQQVATAKRMVKKQTFIDTAFNGMLKIIGSYIIMEVLVPAAKNTLSDIVNNATDMLLYGEPRNRRRDRAGGSIIRGGSRVSYQGYYDGRDSERVRDYRRDSSASRSRFNSDEVVFPTRKDADLVVQGMIDILERYDEISIADFLELSGLQSEYTDRAYGWSNLRDIHSSLTRAGFIVVLPDPKLLSK